MSSMKGFSFRSLSAAGVLSLTLAAPLSQAIAAETRSYVVSWFHLATYSQEGDCKELNPLPEDQIRINLKMIGKTDAEVDELLKTYNGGASGAELTNLLTNRGRIDGKPVNVYANPTSQPDPNMNMLIGKHVIGFNLDGKLKDKNGQSFEDPFTHEKGVDNQLANAFGCWVGMRATPPSRPSWGQYVWENLQENMPAWLMTISGEDLSTDGPVTVTFDRALEHATRDVNGGILVDATFRLDPDPRSHNEFKGTIRNGQLTVEPGRFHMLADFFLITKYEFNNTHIRLNVKPDGLEGYLGGYLDWLPLYWNFANPGYIMEGMTGVDVPGLFYNMRKLAEADPDPATGYNRAISATFRLEAVPAFIVRPDAAQAKN
jgi:hypothetical protein